MRKYIVISLSIMLIAISCNKSEHIRDKKHEENNLQALVTDKNSCSSYKIINNKVYLLDDVIKDADPKSFECLDDGFSKDQHHVYFGLKKNTEADPRTFIVLTNGYSKDKNYVYYDYSWGHKILGADAKTFEVFSLSLTKDKNFVYYLADFGKIEKIEGVDAKSFRPYKDGYYIDKTYLYSATVDKIAKLDTIDIKSLLDGQ